jgi:uncharacterized membrane protein
MPDRSDDRKDVSRHILPTASNLLGLCFVIFGMAKIYTFAERTLLDEMTAVTILFFLAACLFSYASIRAKSMSDRYEKIADIFFLIGLTSITLVTVVIAFEIVK